MQPVLSVASAAKNIATGSVSMAYYSASNLAYQTRLDIEEAYLQRKTQMDIDFVPNDVLLTTKKFIESQQIAQELCRDLLIKSATEQQALSTYQTASKSLTSLTYILQQDRTGLSHTSSSVLSENYTKMIDVTKNFVQTVQSLHKNLNEIIQTTTSQEKELKKEFERQVQEMHITKMRTQTLRAQTPQNTDAILLSQQGEQTAQVDFEGICHKTITELTELTNTLNRTLYETVNKVLEAEQEYANLRLINLQITSRQQNNSNSLNNQRYNQNDDNNNYNNNNNIRSHNNNNGYDNEVDNVVSRVLGLGGDVLLIPMNK